MKRTTILLLATAVLISLVSCNGYKYETVPGDPTGARIYTLDNGLKVYAIVNKDKPRIDAQVAVKVGSKNDPRETTGLAHYFEHLMFKGTQLVGTQNYEAEKPLLDTIETLSEVYRAETDPDARKAIYHTIDSISLEASKLAIPNEYDKLMASIGANGTNAYTSYDVTCYVENIPSNQIELWAKIQADRFENVVLRGFHTELETIYEEYNMYNAMDQTKASNAMFEGLFEHHPYNTDVIGLPSHLKNPSVTNVKRYHDEWYVPNNMAVVLSGDFDPDEAIKIVAKYFGKLKPNENLKRPEFEPEKPIEKPVYKEVLGNEAPNVSLSWRFPGANSQEALMTDLLSSVLFNGKAGIVDLDVNQQQKTLGMYVYSYSLADYSIFGVEAEPKTGQTLDEVCNIFFKELDKVKAGEFDEKLLKAIVNNEKLRFERSLENTGFMARMAVNSFIQDKSWEDAVVNYISRLESVTKEELVAFANENFKENYVRVDKIQKPDPANVSIDKPHITPIFTNRDTASQFLKDVQELAAQVKPIEPVYVDYSKDMEILSAKSGIEVLYKKNESNGTFNLSYRFNKGTDTDKILPIACDYFTFLGTETMSPEELKSAFYELACDYYINPGDDVTTVNLSGLAENIVPAMKLFEDLILNAKANPEALALLKKNIAQERKNSKHDQDYNFYAILEYGQYGKVNSWNDILPTKDINTLSDEDLLSEIRGLFSLQHRAVYYGPLSSEDFLAILNENHNVPENLKQLDEPSPYKIVPVNENEVVVAPFDANQLKIFSFACDGTCMYDPQMVPIITLYNSYFGSGMNSIVFQEMREARGLAYSAGARYTIPSDTETPSYFYNVIYTQNDKLIDALSAFDEIDNEMPVSEKAFTIAKESVISNIRTNRTTKAAVLNSYLTAEKLGIDYDINKVIFEKVKDYTLDDIVKFQQEYVKKRPMKVLILGRENELDYKSLQKFGKIGHVTTEELFGY